MTEPHRRHLQVAPENTPASTACASIGGRAATPGHAVPAASSATSVVEPGAGFHPVGSQVVAGSEVQAAAAATGRLLRVGDLAKATDKTVRALHLYESLGLIEPERRSKARYRLFAPEMKVRIRWISKLQSLGLSLTEIQAIVQKRQASESARVAAEELRDVYSAKLAEVRRSIDEYQSLERELEASLTFLDDCHSHCSSGEGATGCSSCQRLSEKAEGAPDLIMGAQLDAAPARHI